MVFFALVGAGKNGGDLVRERFSNITYNMLTVKLLPTDQDPRKREALAFEALEIVKLLGAEYQN